MMPPYKSKTMIAVDSLREMIAAGRVAPGERFGVRKLAAELNMSVTPVREALRILQAEGLVSYDEHRSISAMQLGPEDAQELYMLRSLLESMLTEMAAKRWDEAAADAIRRQHEAMLAAIGSKERIAAIDANRAWHFAVYAAAQTRFTESVVSRLWSQFSWGETWSVPGRLEQSVEEHAEIMDALLQRDGTRAAELMKRHIEGGRRAVVGGRTDSPV